MFSCTLHGHAGPEGQFNTRCCFHGPHMALQYVDSLECWNAQATNLPSLRSAIASATTAQAKDDAARGAGQAQLLARQAQQAARQAQQAAQPAVAPYQLPAGAVAILAAHDEAEASGSGLPAAPIQPPPAQPPAAAAQAAGSQPQRIGRLGRGRGRREAAGGRVGGGFGSSTDRMRRHMESWKRGRDEER